MKSLTFVVPEGINDAATPSGGNRYDVRVIEELARRGWRIHVDEVPGTWPLPGARDAAGVGRRLGALPERSVVLIDGLLSCGLATTLLEHARRLTLVLLMHMPQGELAEQRIAQEAAAVVATSPWTRRWLSRSYGIRWDRVHVVEPGVDPAELAKPSSHGGRLLQVAAVLSHKGHDVLVDALALLGGTRWQCVCVGAHHADPQFSEQVTARRDRAGLSQQVSFVGPLSGSALDNAFLRSDVLLAPSLMESYGMVVTEALARGLPVIASDVGGVAEALGVDDTGVRPGILVPPADPVALADALRRWLDDEVLRARLRAAARRRRSTLVGWADAGREWDRLLTEVAA